MMTNELPIRAMRGTRFLRAKVLAPALAGLLAASIALSAAAQSANTMGTAAPPATSAATVTASAAESTLANRLQALYPSTRFGAVNPTPWPGVFEVVMGANLAYVDQSGQYFLFGHFYDMKAQRDLTAASQIISCRSLCHAAPRPLLSEVHPSPPFVKKYWTFVSGAAANCP